MGWRPRLLCCLFLSLTLAAAARAATVHQEWEISYQFKSPDCVRKLAVTINGQTPGPTIRATQGDTVVVRVKNSLLTENLAIHWHGIRQIGTPWADGTEGVTQCPILPGDTFTYTFVVDRPGTYLYHAHYGMQRSAGLNVLIVVAAERGGPDAEPFWYDGEHHVLLNDWWHKSTYEQATGLASVPIGWVGEPQSLLINGRGRFVNCSAMARGACNATQPECATPVFAVVPGKTYRFRIASVTSLSALNFEIEGHEMTVVEADGHYVKPFVVKNLNIYSGETYSVHIKADQDPNRNYWLASNVVSREPGTPTGTAVLSYYGGRSSPRKAPPTTPPAGLAWNDTAYRFRQSVATVAHPAHVQPPPQRADRVILLLNTQNKIDGRIKWALNNVSFTLPHTPYLVAMKSGLLGAFDQRPPPETYAHQGYDVYAVQRNPNPTTSDGLYRLRFGSVVDVVLQNANMLAANKSETHPWHLHGHDFWVLGYGIGCFDPAVHPASYNLKDPILKNTVAVHPYANILKKPITVEPVASGSTSSRHPPMVYQQYGAALVAVILYLLLGEFFVALYLATGLADQNPAADESTIARSGPSSSASGSLPVGGGHTPSPSPASASSPSSTDPTNRNRSSATSTTSGEEAVLTQDPNGSPPRRPDVPAADNQGPLLTFVLALLAYDAAVAVGILNEFERIVGTWSTAADVYGVLTVVGIALLAVGLMAAGWHASPMAGGNSNKLSVSAFCAKLGAILFTSLLVVAFSCRLGRWARVAAVPSAAVVACIMAAVWIWGDEHAVANGVVSTCWGRILGQRREREPVAAGDDMV